MSIGVSENVLGRWVKQLSNEREGITPKGKALTPEERRIQKLEARCIRLEWEKKCLVSSGWTSPGVADKELSEEEKRTLREGANKESLKLTGPIRKSDMPKKEIANIRKVKVIATLLEAVIAERLTAPSTGGK